MSEVFAAIFTAAFAVQVIRIAIPYVLAALGGSLTERSGVTDLALEAKLLVGAFTAAAVAHATGSSMLGIAGGAAGGVVVAALQALCVLRLAANQVIVGVALNLAASGVTRYLLKIFYGSSANSPPVPGVAGGAANPILWIALAAVLAVPVLVARTRLGVRIRAAGDRPAALDAAGVSTARVRLVALLTGGALAGIGGAQLSLAISGFTADMSSGRGYLALTAVILGGWRPALAAAACLVFGFTEALVIQLQIHDAGIPRELVQMLPFALTLIVLALGLTRTRPPAALGRDVE